MHGEQTVPLKPAAAMLIVIVVAVPSTEETKNACALQSGSGPDIPS